MSASRIKIAELLDLNDPFELWCSKQDTPQVRSAFRRWKAQMASKYGVLCFSKDWRNPLLWSHYADRHRGMCLGFDVSDEAIKAVKYVSTRSPLALPLTEEAVQGLLYTKSDGWSYEQELRVWVRLQERDPSGFYFTKLDRDLVLREVIAGPLCNIRKSVVMDALDTDGLKLTKARLAFKSFEVVIDRRGFA